jgi:hypothetical protein
MSGIVLDWRVNIRCLLVRKLKFMKLKNLTLEVRYAGTHLKSWLLGRQRQEYHKFNSIFGESMLLLRIVRKKLIFLSSEE